MLFCMFSRVHAIMGHVWPLDLNIYLAVVENQIHFKQNELALPLNNTQIVCIRKPDDGQHTSADSRCRGTYWNSMYTRWTCVPVKPDKMTWNETVMPEEENSLLWWLWHWKQYQRGRERGRKRDGENQRKPYRLQSIKCRRMAMAETVESYALSLVVASLENVKRCLRSFETFYGWFITCLSHPCLHHFPMISNSGFRQREN